MSSQAKKLALALEPIARGKSGQELAALINNFLNFLKKANKIYLLKSVIRELVAESMKQEWQEGLWVQAARPLSQELIKKIARSWQIEPAKVKVSEELELLGRLVIKRGDTVYDFSTKKHLEQLKTFLSV